MNTPITLHHLNSAPAPEISKFLSETLLSQELADILTSNRPFTTIDRLLHCARTSWNALPDKLKRRAINSHPRIGDIQEARARQHSQNEQHGVYELAPETLEELSRLNHRYEEKFGFLYLVFAANKTGAEMLAQLKIRLEHSGQEEFEVASEEKRKINEARLQKMVLAVDEPVRKLEHTSLFTRAISSWFGVVVLYLASLILLAIGFQGAALWPLGVALAMFTVWDAIWLIGHDQDRNAQEILDSSTRARTYMSYFVAIYGAGIVFLLRLTPAADRAAALAVLVTSGVPGWMVIAPLLLCAVALLFFPIKLGIGTDEPLTKRRPTGANVAVLLVSAWIQKVATYTFVYIIVLIASAVWSANAGPKAANMHGDANMAATIAYPTPTFFP